ncbi:MAG: TetR/AcrR family transcriptional regulator [Desulfobacterium sp.]|nr:TetR/AcrR family transcriptional regulator [Desulfobacterium sp.]
MSRKSRSPEVIEKVKNDIIEAALELMLDVGFNNMSMRKLAEKVNMTATNLYYYYSNKDEIYLSLQIKGFRLLHGILQDICDGDTDSHEILKKMIRAYLEFGFTNPDYYRIMLNSDTPRYNEYKGTEVEAVAFIDKQIALDMGELVAKVISDIAKTNPSVHVADADFRAKQMWVTLHGIVVLNNRNILQEADENPDKLIERMCEDLLAPFSN